MLVRDGECGFCGVLLICLFVVVARILVMCYLYRFVSGMRKLIIIFFPLCTCLFIEKPSCNNSLKNCRFMFLTMCVEDLNIRFGSI